MSAQYGYRRAKYDSSEWKAFYLKELEKSPDDDADLLDRLVKITTVERCLADHGKQKPEKLFRNLTSDALVSNEPPPFESADEVAEFCRKNFPLFREFRGFFKNTSLVYRKFCQFLCKQLDLGRTIEERNFGKIVDEFIRETNKTEWKPSDTQFDAKMIHFDLDFVYSFAKEMPVLFTYNERTKRLGLQPLPSNLDTLRKPIFAHLYNVMTATIFDWSRRFLVKGKLKYDRKTEELSATVYNTRFLDGFEILVPFKKFPADTFGVSNLVVVDCLPKGPMKIEALSMMCVTKTEMADFDVKKEEFLMKYSRE